MSEDFANPDDSSEMIRLYSYGSHPAYDDDAEYLAAYAKERDEIYATLDQLGPRDYEGIGGAGTDSLEWIRLAVDGITAIGLLLQTPSAVRKVASTLRDAATRIRRAKMGTWRLNQTAMIIDCCDQVRAAVGDDHYRVQRGEIRATLFVPDKGIEDVFPEGASLISVPNKPTNETFIFLVQRDFTTELLRRVPGQPAETPW